jgi:general secretion pathway protein K
MITVMTVASSSTTDACKQPDHAATPGGRCLPGERGFSLLIVLLVLGFLALLESHFVAVGRAGTALARNNRAAAQVKAAARGAIEDEIFALLRGATTAPRQLRLGGMLVNLTIANEGSLINPNLAGAIELTTLLQELGADTHTASSLAAAILDWRTGGTLPRPGGAKEPQYRAAGRVYAPADTSFHSVAELGLVLGMNPAMLDLLRPHLTVFTSVNPIGASSDPLVARAIQSATSAGSRPTGGDLGSIAVQRITARAYGPDGASTVMQAVVRLNATPDGLPFEVLSWRSIAG